MFVLCQCPYSYYIIGTSFSYSQSWIYFLTLWILLCPSSILYYQVSKT